MEIPSLAAAARSWGTLSKLIFEVDSGDGGGGFCNLQLRLELHVCP